MTAEIAVMNKSAVALAADSAVTVTSGNGSKIYNGAEKLFALSKQHPVGIMVYGSGTLCGVPWELIIKEYRKSLNGDSFDTLAMYAENFWQFIEHNNRLIPNDLRESHLNNIYFNLYETLFKVAELKVEEFISENQTKPSEQETDEILIAIATEFIANITQGEKLPNFTDEVMPTLNEYVSDFVSSKLRPSIEATLSEDFWKTISSLLEAVTCHLVELGNNSGIVFAGYGELEYFPTVLAFNLGGYFGNILRYKQNMDKSSIAGDSGLIAYAQEEVVHTFMSGIHPQLRTDINDLYYNAFEKTLQTAIPSITHDLQLTPEQEATFSTTLINCSNRYWSDAFKEINHKIEIIHQAKAQQMIEFLPKDELGYMAESLVNMTAFKRKVSNDSETVGGPIDVAIISKGDGFIWVKRKHYFKKELNEHYFKR